VVGLPLFMLLTLAAALGVGLWVAALIAEFRDFRFILPFLTQVGMFISPVAFSSSLVPESWRLLYSVNPIAGAIDGFRWSLLGGGHALDLPALTVSCASAVLLLAGGVWYFRRTERRLADVI
jgi:lipopolysaccharide transport system permease protein